MEILKDLQQEMQRVTEAREANRDAKLKDHVSMVGDGIGALSWVAIDPKPADFVSEVLGGAQFYGNRVLKEYKDKYGIDVSFAGQWLTLLGIKLKSTGCKLTTRYGNPSSASLSRTT